MKNLPNRRQQGGFTLVELLISGAILLVAAAGISVVMLGLLDDSRGKSEGERIVNAAQCGVQKARSMGSVGSATFAVLLNNGCFGRDESITNPGAASATLNNGLLRLPYAVAPCTIDVTDDGLGVETRTGVQECPAVVEAAAQRAVIIGVTPSGGSEVLVKNATTKVDLAAVGLNSACKGAAPITVRACVRY